MTLKKRPGNGRSRLGSRRALASCLATTGLAIAAYTALPPAEAHAERVKDTPDIAADCVKHTSLIEWCDFMAETEPKQINDKDTPTRPDLAQGGPEVPNCDSPKPNIAYRTISGSAGAILSTEKGDKIFNFEAGLPAIKAKGDIFAFNIAEQGKTASADYTVRMEIPPGYIGELMFEPYMVQVKGWWNAHYKEKQYGHWNWFSGKGGTYYVLSIPRVLPGTNLPDGKAYSKVRPCDRSTKPGESNTPLSLRSGETIPADIVSGK